MCRLVELCPSGCQTCCPLSGLKYFFLFFPKRDIERGLFLLSETEPRCNGSSVYLVRRK